MQIYVDADACPVVDIVEKIAKKYEVPSTLICDTNHVLHTGYSQIRVVEAGADAVDFALVTLCHKGDIVVTQDYGVAAMALGKGAYVIHQSYQGTNFNRKTASEFGRSFFYFCPKMPLFQTFPGIFYFYKPFLCRS